MSLRLHAAVGCALLALAPLGARAQGGRPLDRLERVLEARGRGAEAGPDLAPLLLELERQDRSQRAEFEAAARRPLPAKARERLEATRRAWSAGQGRLVEMLRGAREPRRAAVADGEALALLRTLRAASRREPLSAGELKTRVPALQPPPLAVGPLAQATPGDEPPIGTLAPEIRQQAASFSGPIEIYEWVRNAIRPELYHGVMKGPRQTMLEASGNDADTAGLLIALLRARGIPARYVRGTVELPAAAAVAITGTAAPERALRAFERTGIPSTPVLGAGAIRAIRVERVWVEAYLPYANYRGALLDAHEKAWVPLDPGFKRLVPPQGYDVRGAGFDPARAFEDYLALAPALTPRELYRQRAEAALAESGSPLSYEEALARRDVIAQNLGLLPGSLPYTLVTRAEVGYAPPESLVHSARFVLESNGVALLDASFDLPSLLGERLTLSYVPFDEGDEEVVRQYGGLFRTPPYLVEVRPVLRLGGIVLASGTTGAGLGVTLDFRLELATPGGRDTVLNRVLAGNLTAIGLAAGRVTADESAQDEAAQVLARLAFHYLDRWNRSDEELAALLRVVPIRPSVSTCFVQSAVEVDYAGGDPLYPARYDWKGLAIDADRRPSAPVGIEKDAAERDFLLASGLEGSVLEHRLFEDDLGVASVSTAKALQLARQQGLEVLHLGPGDEDGVLPGLPLDAGVKDEIREALAAGRRVRVPAGPLGLMAWSGVGYLILDPDTGETAWQLQGGHSGGVTAPAVVDLPSELVDVVWRQSDSPSPRPGGVAHVQKFDTTDYQTGTVDAPLAKPLKVLVTDEEGFPVPGAPVTFSVIGGGGLLVDPATGRADADEMTVLSCVGGEEAEPCASLRPGEAVATLRLGRRTGEIPRYTCEEPFTCTCPSGDCDPDDVGYATQVGLNLVTASAGGAVLAEPFTAVAFPERAPAEGPAGSFTFYLDRVDAPSYGPVNLTVADRLTLLATDRFRNPLSNVNVRVAYRPSPVLGPVPVGFSLYRPANATPGHVLRARDYAACAARSLSVIWGECAGEAESVVTHSSTRGVFVYPVVGDSPWSYYFYDIGGIDSPDPVTWVGYHTDGYYCPAPTPSSCQAWDAPQMLTWQGTRPVYVNRAGNLVEAYPPGASAQVGLWADAVYEEARVERSIDSSGKEHFRAKGTNRWRREHLQDSVFDLAPLTPGTQVTGRAPHVGDGRYAAPMTMGPSPQLNRVGITGRHFPLYVKYLGGDGSDVDPATVDAVSLTLRRVKDPSRPLVGRDEFRLWGVETRIEEVKPTPVRLSSAGTVLQPSTVKQAIEPAEYAALLEPNDVGFDLQAADGRDVLSANGSGGFDYQIPAGLSLASGGYQGTVSIRGVSADSADLRSAPFPLPVCSLVDLLTPQVELNVTRDPLNGRLCGSGDKIRFTLCRAARVTLTVTGAPFIASLDGGAPQSLADITLGPGTHEVLVPVGLPELESDRVEPFRLEARDAEDPAQATVADGAIMLNVVNRSVLPVGHTFVKGVDLLDGHLVQQSADFKVPGRHLGLEVTRTYSSAGWSSQGPLGGGWSLNYASSLFVDGGCGLATVVTPDGSSQVFQSNDGLVSFTPQKGYHTRLDRDGNVYRFTDKAGNVHHFESPDPDGRPRLDFVEEPHGDRLVLTYDGASRLTKVAEVHPEAAEPVRAVTFTYQPIYGEDRIVRAEIAALGLAVDYEYDARGNLTKATRSGQNLGGAEIAATEPRVEGYRYLTLPAVAGGQPSAGDLRKEHQLVETTDPNGHRREYIYYAESDTIPGEAQGSAGGLLFGEKWELVKRVLEHPDPALSIRTEFLYDLTHWPAAERWTTVRDGRGQDTLYVLNGDGSPLRIEEPLGKTTTMVWAPDDILKMQEVGPRTELYPQGRTTDFGYDPRGNLTSERIQTPDLNLVETSYEYDPRFNKLTFKRDAEGRETRYTIDPATGDLLQMTDAALNFTDYVYDEHGRLHTVTDPRRHTTTHSDHDSFGNACTLTDPLGNVTTREYDERGRLFHERDTFGRDTWTEYDGLDRPVEVRRLARGASDDELTKTEYYPGGEVRSVTNANGAKTSYAIDGMSRVVGTETRFDDQVLTTATSYDANGNKETDTDRRGVRRKHTYNDLNQLVNTEIVGGLPDEGPLGQVAAFTYDLVGNKRTETDVNRLVTEFRYDGLYHLEKKILPARNPATSTNYEELYRYDKVGNLRRITDANGKATETEYDGLNRVTKVTRDVAGLELVTTTGYNDSEGSHVNKSEETDVAKGLRTTFFYDELNRETERKVHLEGEDGDPAPNPQPYTTTTVYEDADHAVRVMDPRLVVTRRKLDGLDRVIEEVVDVAGLAGALPLNLTTTTAYDGLGNRKSIRDPEGRTTLFRHDGLGRLVTTTDAKLQETSFTYDGEGLKASETDRRRVKKLVSYDNLGRLRKTKLDNTPFSGVGWSHETQYVDSLQPKRIEIDARGKRTTFDLDGLGRVIRETDHLGNFRTFTWDGVNKVDETDKRRNKTLFEYDRVNRLTKTTDPLLAGEPTAHTVETTYEDALNRVTEKDRRGTVKRTQTDALGRVVKVTDAVGTTDEALVERSTWDGNGNRETQTDAEGHVTRFVYDAANRVSSRTDGFGTAVAATTSFKYDGVGNLLEERDARAAELGEPWSVKETYDELNRLETETNGELETSIYGYDPEGNRTSAETPRGPVTRFEYDEIGKLTKVIQPPPAAGLPSPVTQYAYDDNRNRILQTDANDHSVAMEYDDLNRLKKTTQDLGGLDLVTETIRFDENGNPEVVVDPKGQTTTSSYDELNRLKTQAFAFAPADTTRPWRYTASIEYGYDANGNLQQTDDHVASGTDPPGPPLVTTRAYDGLDRLATESQALPDGGSRTVRYSYYRNGLRQTVTDPTDSVTQYAYDSQNRLETATTGFGTADAKTTAYTYWPDDLLHTVTYPNGVVATHEYDKADRVLSITNAKDTTPISSYQYSGLHPTTGLPVSYDANGNRLIQVETNGGTTETTAYGYDDLDRLASITYPVDTAYPQGRLVSYGYDAVGNRIRETEKDAADVVLADQQGLFDNANRLTELTDLVAPANSTTFTWDRNGNQLTKAMAGVTTENRYDLRDKLVEVQLLGSSAPQARFQYDSEGRRNLKIGEGNPGDNVRQYVYDQTSLLAEYDGAGSQKAKYDYGSDRLISLTRTDEGRRYFSLDGLRSVVNLTDDSGSAVASYHLDTWGNFRFPAELTQSANRFAFTGHIFDTETGLYHAKARYFDPKLGRFLTQDSFLGEIDEPPSLHRYVYGWNRPTFYIDRTGHAVSVATESEEEKPQQRLLGGSEAKIGPSEGGSAGRGAFYYTLETGAELISPIPLGLSSPETSVHPLAGDNQATEDYEAFKAKYGRGAQAVEGAAAMKYGGKFGKLVGVTMIIGAAIYGANEINGTQAEEGNLGPDKGDREPLPAEKEKLSRPPVRAGERTTFEDFRARSIPGDALEGHELVQHAKMRDQGLAGKRRLSTAASKQNPVIALERATHGEVTAAQVEQGTKDLPIVRSLRANVKILLEKTEIPRHEIAQLLKDAYAHAKKWKVE